MKYRNIVEGSFITRPNRFLAEVEISGKRETVHVKNTGRCRELLLPGTRVYLTKSENPNRKTAYDLIGVHKDGLGLVNMDSQAPNAAVLEWLKRQKQGEEKDAVFSQIGEIRPEFVYGRSRIDFFFEADGKKCLMEVKGVTLERQGKAFFPDAPTQRGIKHLQELQRAQKDGYDCYAAFVIQMPGICEIYPNDETHPAFGEALREAENSGVRILALGCEIGIDTMRINRVRQMHYGVEQTEE